MTDSPHIDQGERDGIAVVRRDAVVEVVLTRPQTRNALDLAAWRQLAAVFARLASEDDHIVIVLRGAGRHLSVGSDITQFPKHRTGMQAATEYNEAIANALTQVSNVPHPVVAQIRGMAVGGGCELACAADVRIAASDARFGVPIARLGVSIGAVEARTLLRVLSAGQLKMLLLTARMLSADEAHRIGLVDVVVPSDELDTATHELVTGMARGAPIAARANKLTVNAVADGRFDEVASHIQHLTEAIYEGSDLQEGIRAFIEKRPPNFGRWSTERPT